MHYGLNNKNNMATYRLAIDETGSFNMANYDNSFVCGVVVTSNELNVKQKYQEAFKMIRSCEEVPNDTESLIGTGSFHYNELSDNKKNICRDLLMPLVDEIYISKNKPALFANNQNWWLIATSSVILKFLKNPKLQVGDKVEVLIDHRKDTTFGLINTYQSIETLEHDERYSFFCHYHSHIKKQIDSFANKIADARGLNLKISFRSDTSSFFVNLADIACGFVRTERVGLSQKVVECDCRKFMDSSDPALIVDSQPRTAMGIMFQEIANNNFQNIRLIDNSLLRKFRKNDDDYQFLWRAFYDLLKLMFSQRENHSQLVLLKPLVDTFLNEFKKVENKNAIRSQVLEIMILFVEYFSHIGAIQSPFDKETVLNALKGDSEARLLRKWEKYVSYSLREAQLLFNGYRFSESLTDFEDIWNKQEQVINSIPDIILADNSKKDEPTTAIIGSLAQSYAYNGDLEKAIEYFEMSKEYAIRTTERTDSYLFSIYHRLEDIENARQCFEGQTGKAPEEYARKGDYNDNWELLSYCRLRALELHKNGQTNLAAVDLQNLKNYNSGYPFPLIQKWEGIALWLKNPKGNKEIVAAYFTDAIEILLNENSGFAIKALALSIIQCFAVVDNQNPYQARYNTILRELKESSSYFDSFVNQKADLLNQIRNDSTIWKRAMLLPFIYA